MNYSAISFFWNGLMVCLFPAILIYVLLLFIVKQEQPERYPQTRLRHVYEFSIIYGIILALAAFFHLPQVIRELWRLFQ